MNFPKRIIKEGESNAAIVKAIQKRLIELGIGNLQGTGVFGPKTKSAVKLFQSLHRDKFGMPLVIDGKVGAITWEVLFGADSVPVTETPANDLLDAAITFALTQVGVREVPVGSNRGPEVDEYLRSTNTPLGSFWCAAFVYFCFNKAAANIGKANPLIKTAGSLDHWNRTTAKKITAADALNNPALIKPGSIFIIDHGGGHGHTGIVQKVDGGFVHTIEGNSNSNGSSNGIGVFNLPNRKLVSINKGFIQYK